ncbi:hypothetical protein WICMUC_005234 [Wickerhamomyces mucosus]|uniref:rRNA biogenesis protein RRP36 n=1 Tax=Wickerhamomyces mucosus TaxID=1378264 RepID=A0A9P8T6V8_9ASCO|nr:hypothetical protein WICMUC_005234 [Wickerhamomyces mucosus]
MAKKHLKPVFNDDYDDDLDNVLNQDFANEQESEDEFATLSFGALKSAQTQMDQEDAQEKQNKKKSKGKRIIDNKLHNNQYKKNDKRDSYEEEENNEEEGDFFDSDDSQSDQEEGNQSYKKKKSKHAPTEQSSKKRPNKIRDIPGLDVKKSSTLFQDIRFDKALGKADLSKVRQNYKFLDEYRENEINEIKSILTNKKLKNKLSGREINELEYEQKSLKSRLESLKSKDLQDKIIRDYQREHNSQNGGNKYYLKDSEKRKIIQKFKFDNMKKSQIDKVMERKRKRRLGKEFKQLEFNRPRN